MANPPKCRLFAGSDCQSIPQIAPRKNEQHGNIAYGFESHRGGPLNNVRRLYAWQMKMQMKIWLAN